MYVVFYSMQLHYYLQSLSLINKNASFLKSFLFFFILNYKIVSLAAILFTKFILIDNNTCEREVGAH